MRAFGIEEYGAEPRLLDIPSRAPGEGEISLAIKACGLNFADLLMAEGKYQERPEPPVILGMEVAGEVLETGAGVHGLHPGTQVVVFAGSGGLAETGCFPAERAVTLPKGTAFADAAGFQVAYGTSHVALKHRARLAPDETLVVLGAAGGVGLAAVEIGKLMGARVIAVARGAERLAVVKAAGADHLINSEGTDLRAELKALGGADVVYDPVGGAQFEAAFRASRPEARILTIGFASGEVPQIKANHLMVKNLTVMGLYWGGYLTFRPEVVRDSLATLLGWHAEGRLRPHVSHILPLERAGEALALLRERKATGKVVVTI
jgi:NADPH2:quinone reductase